MVFYILTDCNMGKINKGVGNSRKGISSQSYANIVTFRRNADIKDWEIKKHKFEIQLNQLPLAQQNEVFTLLSVALGRLDGNNKSISKALREILE